MKEPQVINKFLGYTCEYVNTATEGPCFMWRTGNKYVVTATTAGITVNTELSNTGLGGVKKNGFLDFLKVLHLAIEVHKKLDNLKFLDEIDAVKDFIRGYEKEMVA